MVLGSTTKVTWSTFVSRDIRTPSCFYYPRFSALFRALRRHYCMLDKPKGRVNQNANATQGFNPGGSWQCRRREWHSRHNHSANRRRSQTRSCLFRRRWRRTYWLYLLRHEELRRATGHRRALVPVSQRQDHASSSDELARSRGGRERHAEGGEKLWQVCRSVILPARSRPSPAFKMMQVARLSRGIIYRSRDALHRADRSHFSRSASPCG